MKPFERIGQGMLWCGIHAVGRCCFLYKDFRCEVVAFLFKP
jgi:hypothetical protein